MSNNITKDWNAVLKSAQAGLAATERQIDQVTKNAQPFQSYVDSAQREVNETKAALDAAIEKYRPRPALNDILDLEDAARLDPTNAAKQKAWKDAITKYEQQNAIYKQQTATLQQLYNDSLIKLGRARSDLVDAKEPLAPLLRQADQYQVQINEANRQLGIQAKATTPGTNTTVAGTVTPASSSPGNPNQATVTTTSTQTTANSVTRTTVTNTTNTTANATTVTRTVSTTTNTTSTGVAAAGAAIVVTAPQKAVANTADVPLAISRPTESLVPELEPKTVSDPGTVTKYTVKSGDTLTAIAKKYGITLAELIKANPQIKNPDLIKVGEVINIPGKNQTPVAGTGADAPLEEPDVGGSEGSAKGLDGRIIDVQAAASAQDQANFEAFEDWRVRLTLAPDANYLYRADEPGILSPLAATDGVVFPYTPLISVNYAASYDQSTITHSNYKIYQYQGSSVDTVSITCDFTAQDVFEANYLLATIHFFRAATKMFYGQDQDPKPGTPPPLVFLFGLGGFQFEAHPLAITGFSYSLPNDVDYIPTTASSGGGEFQDTFTTNTSPSTRLPPGVQAGGTRPAAKFDVPGSFETPTYVPTKIQLSISCVPIVSRNSISNRFSFKDYATGRLLQGTRNVGGGIW